MGITSMMRITFKKLERLIIKLLRIFKRVRHRIRRVEVRKLKEFFYVP